MSLLQFSATCFVVLLLAHYLVLPWLRRKVRADPSPASLPRIAWMAVVRYVRGIAVVGALTALAVALVVQIMQMRGSPLAKLSSVRQAIQAEHGLKRAIDEAHPYWFGAVAVILTSALGIYTYRQRRAGCSAAFAAIQEAEFERLLKQMAEDPTWWDLPPNEDMTRLLSRILEIDRELPNLSPELRARAERAIEHYKELFVRIDIFRRMDLRCDPDAVEEPEPETWRDWASGLVGSRRVVGSTRAGTRWLYRLNALLLVAGLIGFQSEAVQGVFHDRLASLNDLSIRLSNLEDVGKEVAQGEADLAEEQPEAGEQKPATSTKTVTPRGQTWASQASEKTATFQEQARAARAARPNYGAEDDALTELAARAEKRSATAKAMADLDAEAHRVVKDLEPGRGAKPPRPDGPDAPGDRLARLRERLEAFDTRTDPDGPLKPKAEALRDRLAATDPESALRQLDGEAAAFEAEVRQLKAAARARPDVLQRRLWSIEFVEGHSDEMADLARRIDQLRSDTGGRYDRVLDRLGTVRSELASERSGRLEQVSARRSRAGTLVERVESIDRSEALMPAKADEVSTRIASAEARLDWETGRAAGPASPSPSALTEADQAAARVVARTYEEALGESAPLRGTLAEPDVASTAKLRSLATRNEILDRARRVAPSERVRPPTPAEAPPLNGVQRRVATAAESVFRADAPRTAAGEGIYEQIVGEMRASPRFREAIRTQAPAARARLMAGAPLAPRAPPSGRLLGELSLTAFDSAVSQVAGPEAADAFGQIARSTLQNHEKARRFAFMKELTRGDSGLKSALDRIMADDPRMPLTRTGREYLQRVQAGPGTLGETVRAVAPFEPSIEVPFERGVNLERAGAISLNQGKAADPGVARYRVGLFTEAMESYADTFPSQPGIERVTPRGQILEAVERRGALTKGLVGGRAARPRSRRGSSANGPSAGSCSPRPAWSARGESACWPRLRRERRSTARPGPAASSGCTAARGSVAS